MTQKVPCTKHQAQYADDTWPDHSEADPDGEPENSLHPEMWPEGGVSPQPQAWIPTTATP